MSAGSCNMGEDNERQKCKKQDFLFLCPSAVRNDGGKVQKTVIFDLYAHLREEIEEKKCKNQ